MKNNVVRFNGEYKSTCSSQKNDGVVEEMKPKSDKKAEENPYIKMADKDLIALYHQSVCTKRFNQATAGMVAHELVEVRGYTLVEHDNKLDEFIKKVA